MSCTDVMFTPESEKDDRFPFDDDSRRDLDYHLDRLAEEHPDIAEPLRNWREDKASKKKRTDTADSSHSAQKSPSSESCSTRSESFDSNINKTQEPTQTHQDTGRENIGLQTKLRYTVPDMRREQEEELDRVGRSQSAPPSQQTDNHHGQHQQAPAREPVVRHIPIYVEGRDEPVIPKDFEDTPYPREKRNLSRESSPVPPSRRIPQENPSPEPRTQPHIHQEHPQQQKHTSSVHINHSGPTHHQGDRQVPIEIKINHEQSKQQNHQQGQAHNQQGQAHNHQGQAHNQQGQAQQPAKQPPPKLILGPLEKVHSVQEEVGSLMERVEKYNGGSRQDKEYVYLDEMLTRNLLKLDDIETEGKEDVRAARKEAIRQIQRCISHLESKAPTTDIQSTVSSTNVEQTDVKTEDQPNSTSIAPNDVQTAETQPASSESTKGSS